MGNGETHRNKATANATALWLRMQQFINKKENNTWIINWWNTHGIKMNHKCLPTSSKHNRQDGGRHHESPTCASLVLLDDRCHIVFWCRLQWSGRAEWRHQWGSAPVLAFHAMEITAAQYWGNCGMMHKQQLKADSLWFVGLCHSELLII